MSLPREKPEGTLMDETEQMLKELQSIKKLLILLLIKSGATSEEIGQALSVDSSTIRKTFPMKRMKRAKGD
jgi:ATP/maltotriose-dependent transcriptional regulator MalT